MAERIYNATAEELMTSEVKGKPANKKSGDVHDWLAENDFTAAPIYTPESEEPLGYVERRRIEDRSADIRTYTESFDLSNIISTGADFEELLPALSRRYFYFLGGADRLLGILTRADLNKSPAYIHLYERITYFEELLREFYQGWGEDWKSFLKDGAVGSIKGRREDHSGLSLDHVYYANFSHLTTVIYESDLFETLGFDSATQAENQLDDIDTLRNDVAHRKLILENDNIDSNSSARDIKDLENMYNTLMNLIRELEKMSTTSAIERQPSVHEEFRAMYAGTCQVCGEQDLEGDAGQTTELAHILPVHKGGENTQDNLLNLCPNHHKQFDLGELRISSDDLTVEKAPESDYIGQKLILAGNHSPKREYIKQHNEMTE